MIQATREVKKFHEQVGIGRLQVQGPRVEDGVEHHDFNIVPLAEELMSCEPTTVSHRIGLMLAEVAELMTELRGDQGWENRKRIIHESMDVIYVTLGTLVTLGFSPIEIHLAWDAVHRSNMTKKGTLETRYKTAEYVPPQFDFIKPGVTD